MNITLNSDEIKILNMLHFAYENNDSLGLELELESESSIVIESLIEKKLAAFASEILALTINGLNYCIHYMEK
jgi:hypothetical protein